MSQRNMKNRRKRNKSSQYLFFAGILFLAVISASSFLQFRFSNMIKTHSMAETTYGGLQSEAYNSIQNTGENEQWNLMLVDKNNPIPDDYEVNLVEVEGGEYVDERIYEPLMEMLNDAREGNLGELPMVVSGYRTQEKQQSLYDEKIAKFKKEGYSGSEAVEQAEQWVAVPGYSEHQLGFAVDINGATYDVYLWLQENSYKYGFIFRYPGSKTDITGIAEEVWHYRYVGKDAAKEIYERGICLEEYLGDFCEP